jgi:hypothetical protein
MTDSRRKMLERVRAILAKTMANGCTEGEAMAALAKARELMAAYEISESELEVNQEQERATIYKSDRNDPYRIRQWLALAVAYFTRCTTWRGTSAGYAIAFCGIESDVIFATWLLETLQNFVLREVKHHLATRRAAGKDNPRIVSVSFVAGCCNRINQRLKALTPSEPVTASEFNAPVISRNALIAKAMADAGIELQRGSRYRPRVDGAALAAGNAAGNGAQFNRPVSADGPLLLR